MAKKKNKEDEDFAREVIPLLPEGKEIETLEALKQLIWDTMPPPIELEEINVSDWIREG